MRSHTELHARAKAALAVSTVGEVDDPTRPVVRSFRWTRWRRARRRRSGTDVRAGSSKAEPSSIFLTWLIAGVDNRADPAGYLVACSPCISSPWWWR